MNQPLTADPPGLAEAIEAAADAAYESDMDEDQRWPAALKFVQREYRRRAAAGLRVAAPILTRAALLEAADEVRHGRMVPGYVWADLLRERADRIGGGE
jgi:hypothetical protein